MDQVLETLKQWKGGNYPGPVILDISPTDSCNLKCRSCWMRNEEFEGRLDSRQYELSEERLLGLIDEADELGIKHVELTGGGEPLMRKVTKDIIRKIKQYGMYGSMTTNGTLFTEDLIEEVIRLRWDKIVFSIDGGYEKSQNFLRGRDYTFKKNLEALMLFKRLKRKYGSDKPLIHFNTVLSKVNFKELDKIIRLADHVGCQAVNFETLTVHSKIGQDIKLGIEEQEKFSEIIQKIEALARKLNVDTNIAKYNNTRLIDDSNKMQKNIPISDGSFAKISCYEPWYHLVIKVDGSVGPCCVFSDKKVNVRNATLKEIWHGKYFKNLRDRMRKGKLLKYCNICNAGQLFRNIDLRERLNEK